MNSPALEQFRMYIGGKWCNAGDGARFDSVNPYTGRAWASVPDADASDVGAAVAAAREAFDSGPWRETTPQQRGEMMRRLAALIGERAEALARAERFDDGQSYQPMLSQWR